jgi:hypothetical protein
MVSNVAFDGVCAREPCSSCRYGQEGKERVWGVRPLHHLFTAATTGDLSHLESWVEQLSSSTPAYNYQPPGAYTSLSLTIDRCEQVKELSM